MYSNLINAEILIFVYHISGIERIPPFPLRSMILRDSRSLGLLDFVVPMCIASRSTKTICYCFLYTPLGAIFYPSCVLWQTIVKKYLNPLYFWLLMARPRWSNYSWRCDQLLTCFVSLLKICDIMGLSFCFLFRNMKSL